MTNLNPYKVNVRQIFIGNLLFYFLNVLYILAGDYVKFNLPAGQALTTLAWGGISYQAGYKCAGEFENLLEAVKWGTDYFIKCHVSDNEYYAQVRFLYNKISVTRNPHISGIWIQ